MYNKLIKDNIYKENDQLKIGKGYDHPFIFNNTKELPNTVALMV